MALNPMGRDAIRARDGADVAKLSASGLRATAAGGFHGPISLPDSAALAVRPCVSHRSQQHVSHVAGGFASEASEAWPSRGAIASQEQVLTRRNEEKLAEAVRQLALPYRQVMTRSART